MTSNNTTQINNVYGIANGTNSTNAFVDIFMSRDPTPNDVNYPIQKKWFNTVTKSYFLLENFISANGIVSANWVKIFSSNLVESLTGDSGGPVFPDASNNIDVLGSQGIKTQGSANTITIQGQPALAAASSSLTNLGVASFNNTNFTVDTNGFVTLIGGAQSIGKINVDANTPPGTNPVVAASGAITVTGSQVAAGTTSNVIRTDSLAANTLTIEIQRSQAVASTTIADNGVSHFDNSKFSVDANGFVSLASSFFNTGVFTPALTFGGSSTGITYSSAPSGKFTQIGNIVLFSIGFTLTSKGSATGAATVTGLPITAVVGNNVLMNSTEITLPTQTYQILGEISSSSTSIILVCSSGTSPGVSAQMDNTFFLNNTSVQCEGFYYTS